MISKAYDDLSNVEDLIGKKRVAAIKSMIIKDKFEFIEDAPQFWREVRKQMVVELKELLVQPDVRDGVLGLSVSTDEAKTNVDQFIPFAQIFKELEEWNSGRGADELKMLRKALHEFDAMIAQWIEDDAS